MADYGPGGGGVNKNAGAPACTAKYYPAMGGYEGGAIEGDGELGQKADAGSPDTGITGDTVNGNYENQVSYPPGIPHGQPDPDCGGPPLGSTPDDPTRSMY